MTKDNTIKFVIISPYEEIHSYGVRSLSSYLKGRGIRVNIVFARRQSRLDAYVFYRNRSLLPISIVNDISRIARDATCIGISLMTDYLNVAIFLTRELKKRLPHIPILWGGVHPTSSPEQCAEYADFVCVGEGYGSTYELLQCIKTGDKIPRVPGIFYKRGEEFIIHDVRPPISDIDSLPFMDYDLEGHYIRSRDSIIPLTSSLLNYNLGFWYTSFFTHGCPFSCSYCCNSILHALSPGYRTIRKHSPEYIIEEIKFICKKYPFIKMVKFNDDNFLSLSENSMGKFASLQEKFGKVPFVVTGMNPSFVTEQKIDILVKAGLRRARIGVQTGSKKTLREIYNRKTMMEDIIRSSEILSKYSKQLVPTAYDIILDNPWEKPEDLVDTFNLICQLRRPLVLNIFSLTLYPNTVLWHKSFKEKAAIDNDCLINYAKSYLAWNNNYLNCLVVLAGITSIPYCLRKYLLNSRTAKKNPLVPKFLRNFINGLMFIKKGYAHISRGDVTMLPYFLARLLRCK